MMEMELREEQVEMKKKGGRAEYEISEEKKKGGFATANANKISRDY